MTKTKFLHFFRQGKCWKQTQHLRQLNLFVQLELHHFWIILLWLQFLLNQSTVLNENHLRTHRGAIWLFSHSWYIFRNGRIVMSLTGPTHTIGKVRNYCNSSVVGWTIAFQMAFKYLWPSHSTKWVIDSQIFTLIWLITM